MTTLFGYRQRAEDFAARVDGGPGGLPEAGRRRGGATPAETDALVGLVAALREHAELDDSAHPSPAFTTDLRDRLLAEAALTPARTPIGAPPQTSPSQARSSVGDQAARPSRARERLVVAGTAAAILIGGTAGVANAAQNALPGQALYPVKRSIEGVNAGLSESSSAHGRALLDQASTRLDEVRGLDAGGPLERELIPGTLDEFTRQAHEGAQLLMLGYRETDDPKSIEEVRAFAADQLPVLTTLSSSTSDGAEFQLRNAAVALRSIDSDASTACDNCSDLAPLDMPPVALTALEVDGSPPAASNGASDLLPTREDEGAEEGDGVDAGAPLPGTGSAPAATPTGDALLLPGVSPSGATPTTTGSAVPAATNGAQPAAGTGSPVIPGTSAAAPGSLPGTVATPTTGTVPGSSTSAPPRIPILTLPSGASVGTVSSTPSGVAAPSSQPAPSPAPAVPGPSVPVVPTPVATSPAAPTSTSGSSGSSGSSSGSTSSSSGGSTSSSTSGSSGSTASSSSSTSSSTDSLTSTDSGSGS